MNKEAFDLLVKQANTDRRGAGALLATLDDAKRQLVETASLPQDTVRMYGFNSGKADKLVDRIYSRAAKAPLIQSYDDFSVTRSAPLAAVSGGAGGGILGASLSALLGRRFAPFKSLRNVGRMALGGGGLGAAATGSMTAADNRQMTKAKNMLGTEYDIRNLRELRALAPVVAPKAKKEFLDAMAKQSSLSEMYASIRPQVADVIRRARAATELPINAVPVSSIASYLRSPAGRMMLGSGLAGAAYGFARQKGPNETALGNALRSGLVSAGAGALLSSAVGAPTSPPITGGIDIDWRQRLNSPDSSPSSMKLGPGGVHPNHPMFEQFQRNARLKEIHGAYGGN
jgi:surface antigen